MRKLLVLVVVSTALVGCQTAREDRALTGAAVGGGTGALIGGLASNSLAAQLRAV